MERLGISKIVFEIAFYYTMKSSIHDFASASSRWDDFPSPTGAKTLHLLELLSSHPEGLTAAQMARTSGLTQNLVFRLLKTLLATGFAVQRDDSRTYVLSRKILELSAPQSGDKSLVLNAHEALRWLRDETGETVQLVIEAEGKLLVLEQFRGTQPLQVNGEVGMRVPLYSCAPGKAILAGWSESRREEWYRGPGKKRRRFTDTTLHRRDDLEREIIRIREDGFAVDRAEGIEGIHCVAVLITDFYGQPLGAVTVMAPIARVDESDFASLAQLCRKAVHQIEERLRQ